MQRAGYNDRTVAEAMGIHRTTVWRFLRGGGMRAERVKQLARVLGCEVRDFVRGEDF